MDPGKTGMVHHLVAALIVQGDRILLGRRSPGRAFYPNVWDVFGGHIEPDEQPEQALVRELWEELNITPVQWIEIGIIQDSVPEHDDMPSHDLIVHFYCVTAWEGTPINRQPEEHSLIQWCSYDESIKLELAHPAYPRLFAQGLQSITGNEQ
jgi:8-oxo-dGTP diphosphatase